MKNIALFAMTFAAVIALALPAPVSAQVFAGIGAGLGSALGHGEEESSVAEQPPHQRKEAAFSEHRSAHNGVKAHVHHAKPVHPAPTGD